MRKLKLLTTPLQILTLLITSIFAANTYAQLAPYQEGKHYTIVKDSKKPAPGKNVEVLEVFWYGCSHCFNFETVAKEWKKTKPSFIDFEQMPAMWKKRGAGVPEDLMWTHAKLFYAAKETKDFDKLHKVFFEGMNKYNKRLFNPTEIQDWVSAQSLNGAVFLKMMESPTIKAKVDKADSDQVKYAITGTPEVIVGGHYHVTTGQAGSQKAMLEVATYLAEKIYKGK